MARDFDLTRPPIRAINEAWLLITILTVLALCLAPYAKRPVAHRPAPIN